MHKNTKLLPYQRREAYRRWRDGDRVTDLAKYYRVSRKTLYKVFHKAKLGALKRQCDIYRIPQQFTKPYRSQTNGQAERVIKTIKQLLRKHRFVTREERRRILYAIVRYYNHLRPHQSLGGISPFERLKRYIEETKVELRELRKNVTNA
ncbi:MAG: transposase [Candidatus Sungbacteria bacterium]|uniref:Transposase n=1 Tax=Candidatus Sungiibacteriota bacterium TaxID=2750080 RepID=A0A932DSB1_9BACT|nr:transposase [Candidatus Sungbacteria bacterium]